MGDFAVRLKEHTSVAAGATETFKAAGKRVLIVDDVKMNVLVFKGLLRGSEMTIDSAYSGAEAIEMTERIKYDIIFMDHLMPEMDGIETFHRIREDEENINRDTPVVVLTANALVGMRTSYLKEGFAEYISKPVEQEQLLAVTGELLGR
jgi:CheY-like chemotaxis protein